MLERSSNDLRSDHLLYSYHRALDLTLDLGAVPQRLLRVLYPVWQVQVEGRQRIPQDFEELEWFIERCLHEVGLSSIQSLAQFFGLEERFVHKLVGFLQGIGHIKNEQGHLTLTRLGQESVQQRVRIQEQETSAILYFDGLGSRPLRREHYTIPIYAEPPKSRGFKAFFPFSNHWDQEALQRLLSRPDRDQYNLPDEVTEIKPIHHALAYLPLYVVQRQLGQPNELPLFLAFSRITSLRDQVLEEAINSEMLIQVPLRHANQNDLADAVKQALSQRGLSQRDWYLHPNGPWGPQVMVTASVLKQTRHRTNNDEDNQGLTVTNIGKYLLARDWCVWLTCDDPQVRQQAAIEQLLEWLQHITTTPTLANLHLRLSLIHKRLNIKPISIDTLLDISTQRGLSRVLERLDALVTSDEEKWETVKRFVSTGLPDIVRQPDKPETVVKVPVPDVVERSEPSETLEASEISSPSTGLPDIVRQPDKPETVVKVPVPEVVEKSQPSETLETSEISSPSTGLPDIVRRPDKPGVVVKVPVPEVVEKSQPSETLETSEISSPRILATPDTLVNQQFGDQINGTVINRSPGSTILIQSTFQPPAFSYIPHLRRMIEDYTAIFGGRESELADLVAWLNNPDQPWCLLLAPTGRGKSALLINWIRHLQEGHQIHVAFHSISLRYVTDTADATFRSLASRLASWHNEPPPAANTSASQLRVMVAGYLRLSPPDKQQGVIVLDGLDEAVDYQVGRDLFPRHPPPGLKVLASARLLANGNHDTWLEQLGWERRQTHVFTLDVLKQEAVVEILQIMGDPLTQLVTKSGFVGELYRVSEGDPLTLRFLVEALRNEELSPEQLTRQPPGLSAFLKEWWLPSLDKAAVDSPAVYSLLNACATALGPLTTADLTALVPSEFQESLRLRQAVRTIERSIIGDGQPGSGYVFSHPRLREAFVERLQPSEVEAWREKFVVYGRHVFAYLRNQPDLKKFPDYVRQFWVRHLADSGAWDELEQVLNTTATRGHQAINLWAELRYAAEGSYAGYLADLDLLWGHVDSLSSDIGKVPDEGVQLHLRCVVIASSIRSLAGNLFPELLVQLLKVGTPEGKWREAAVLEHIYQMPDFERQAEALTALAPYFTRERLVTALDIAHAIRQEATRIRALTGLVPHIPSKQQAALLSEAVEAAHAIIDEATRIRALTGLVPHLPPEQQAAVLPKVVEAARTIDGETDRIKILMELVPHLSQEQRVKLLHEAIEIVWTITEEEVQAEALTALAPYFTQEQLFDFRELGSALR